MKDWLVLAFVFGIALEVHAPPAADACGVKLVIKNPSPRRSNVQPIRTDKSQPVVAARPDRKPIAVGPKAPERVVSRKTDPKPEPKPEPKPPEPKPDPVAIEQPKPLPVAEQPKPDPKPVTAPKPVVAAVRGPQELYFGVNSRDAAARKPQIDRVASWMKSDTSLSVVIEGHADPTGNPDYNLALSQQRADAVRDSLIAAGIDGSRIEVQAYGDTKLRYGRADGRNRRVVITPKP
jgi:outer membrane protein OmpA-like peptidoglycan-associated protein